MTKDVLFLISITVCYFWHKQLDYVNLQVTIKEADTTCTLHSTKGVLNLFSQTAIRAYSVQHYEFLQNYNVLDEDVKDIDIADSGHTIVIKVFYADDRSYDELYVDGHYIHPDNWNYDDICSKDDRSGLQFLQHPNKQQRISLGGRLVFEEGHKSGQGVMYFADTRTGVILEELSVDQSKVLVGTYDLTKKGKKVGVLTIHPKGMVINGKKPKNIKIAGNKASWKENSGGGIFREGSVEFSDDGSNVIRSSFNGSGRLAQTFGASRPRNAHGASSVVLHVQGLTSMSPFNIKGDDDVQKDAMDDFYKLVQYFMPADYLHNFISSTRPQLDGYLRLIATDDITPGENAKYYESLAVPYLTYALSKADKKIHPDVAHLNYIRSDHIMKKTMKYSPVFNRHAGKMYRYHWRQKFSDVDDYITDQNSDKYRSVINQKNSDWKNKMVQGLDGVLLHKDVQAMKDYADELGQKAINERCYWAYRVFREVVSTEHFNALVTQLLYTPITIPNITRNQERICSLLTILDPTGYFTSQYTTALQVYQLTSVLPSKFDPAELNGMGIFPKAVLEKFRDMYRNNPDPQLAEMANKINDAINDYGWQRLMPIFTAAASISTNMFEFMNNIKSKFIRLSAKFGRALGVAAGSAAFGFAMNYMANGTIDWNDMTTIKQAEFIVGCVKATVFYVKAGYESLTKLKRAYWPAVYKLLFEDSPLKYAVSKISAAFGKLVVSRGWANKAAQKVIRVGRSIGKPFRKVYKSMTKVLKLKGLSAQRIYCGFTGLMAVLGLIFSSYELYHKANNASAMEIAMDAMFIFSSLCDIYAAGASWFVTGGEVLISGYGLSTSALTTVSSLASGLASAAAIVGFIILMVMIFKPREPPDPIRDFARSDAVKKRGLYMLHKTTIEYFAVQMDDKEESKEIGVTISNGSANGYLYVGDDGALSLRGVDHSYHTVLTISTDEEGYSQIYTHEIASGHGGDLGNIYYVTASNSNDNVTMSTQLINSTQHQNEADRQRWIVAITGHVQLTNKQQLKSATFTIQNLATKKYIDHNIRCSPSGVAWHIALEMMKPAGLSMHNIMLNTQQRQESFTPFLGQPGSTSGRTFSVRPPLPSWLSLNTETGTISQKGTATAPVTADTTYTMTVTNKFGSDSDTFILKVEAVISS